MMIDQLREFPDKYPVGSSLVKGCKVYRIDDVASMFLNNERFHDFLNMPPLTMQYPKMWFEYEYQVEKESLFQQTDLKQGDIIMGVLVSVEREIDLFYLHCSTSIMTKNSVFDEGWSSVTFSADESGQLGRDHEGIAFSMSTSPMFDAFLAERKLTASDTISAEYTLFCCGPAILSMALLNCHNVTTKEIAAPKRKAPRNARQHRKEMAKLPTNKSLERHHTIVIRPMRRRPVSSESTETVSGNKRGVALHEVPGQFKTYGGIDPLTGRERGKLFGRLEGTWYWGPHHRGSDTLGTITSDYEVKLDES